MKQDAKTTLTPVRVDNTTEPFTVNVTWGDAAMEPPLAVRVEARDELTARNTIHRFLSTGAYKAKMEPYVEKSPNRVIPPPAGGVQHTRATSMDEPRIAAVVEKTNPVRRNSRRKTGVAHLLAAQQQLRTLVNVSDPAELARQLDQAINSIGVGIRVLRNEEEK